MKTKRLSLILIYFLLASLFIGSVWGLLHDSKTVIYDGSFAVFTATPNSLRQADPTPTIQATEIVGTPTPTPVIIAVTMTPTVQPTLEEITPTATPTFLPAFTVSPTPTDEPVEDTPTAEPIPPTTIPTTEIIVTETPVPNP